MNQYENPIEEMVLPHSIMKSSNKFFTKETDVILICMTHQCGYGNWPKIQTAIRRENRCRHDHVFLSRSVDELKNRVRKLVEAMDKEQESDKKKAPKTKPHDLSV